MTGKIDSMEIDSDSVHKKSIRIYSGDMKISPIETLHFEANEPPLKLRRNVMTLRFLYKLKINPTYYGYYR